MNNIDILEEFIKDYTEISHFFTKKTKVEIINVRIIVKAIQNLIAENKELKERNKTMLSDEEKQAMESLIEIREFANLSNYKDTKISQLNAIDIVLNLIEKQSKEIEELKETLKCTQNSWFEDTQKIEEMKKQIDLDNECEIALNNKIMDLEKEIEELKEENNILKEKIITIRNYVKPYTVWYDSGTKNYNLKGCSKQEIYKTFSKIRSEVKGEYIFLENDKYLQSLLEKE